MLLLSIGVKNGMNTGHMVAEFYKEFTKTGIEHLYSSFKSATYNMLATVGIKKAKATRYRPLTTINASVNAVS